MSTEAFSRRLVDAASAPYRAAGRFAWHFARGKLGSDPVFAGLLQGGVLPDGQRLLDLGCGQGLLAAWLLAARRLHAGGDWPATWPPPPRIDRIWGLELMAQDVARARSALGAAAEFACGDIRNCDLGCADAVVILDVLHYIDHAAQEALLARIHATLPAGGVFVTRVGDADGGLRFRFSNWVDQTVALARGHGFARFHCRPLRNWIATLERTGFRVEARPMCAGTPFANVLLVAHA